MPEPRKKETKNKFIPRCISYIYHNEPKTLTTKSKNKKSKQAYAICTSIYDRKKKKSIKKNESLICNFNTFVNENYYFIKDETQWMWISPENNVIKVPKLNHKDYIMRQYKNINFGWDYDRVFDKAIEDGWVRVIYEKFPRQYKGELSINGYNKERVKYVLKNVFWDLIRFGNNTIYVDYENPKESNVFSTFPSESKSKLIDFIDH